MQNKTFSELGRTEAVRQLFEGSGYVPFCEPLWFYTKEGEVSSTAQKALLEGVDFNLEYFPLKHLGYKSVVAVTGELLAVMSFPQTLSVSLGISAKLDYPQIEEFWSGVVTAAKEFGYKSLSLSLQPSKNGLCICMTASGITVAGVTRPKAQSKDIICVGGRLGAAYLGQRILEGRKDLEKHRMMLSAYLKPELDPAVLAQLSDAGVSPSFGYFVSAGLADAVQRLSRDSGFGVKIYADKIPFEGGSIDLCRELDVDPVSAAMNGGDDYVLLYVIPISQYETFRREFKTFEAIGHLALPEVGQVLVTPEGQEFRIPAFG